MIPSFTLARSGEDWELVSAGKYEEARKVYSDLIADKYAHDYEEVVMVRIRKRKRFANRSYVRVKDREEDNVGEPVEEEITTEPETPPKKVVKKRGRPRKTTN